MLAQSFGFLAHELVLSEEVLLFELLAQLAIECGELFNLVGELLDGVVDLLSRLLLGERVVLAVGLGGIFDLLVAEDGGLELINLGGHALEIGHVLQLLDFQLRFEGVHLVENHGESLVVLAGEVLEVEELVGALEVLHVLDEVF